jgi:hypothetical protein
MAGGGLEIDEDGPSFGIPQQVPRALRAVVYEIIVGPASPVHFLQCHVNSSSENND